MKKKIKLELSKLVTQAEICEAIHKIHPLNLAEIVEDKMGGKVKFNFTVSKEDGGFGITEVPKKIFWKKKTYVGDTGPWGFSVAFAQLLEEISDDLLKIAKGKQK